MSSRSIDDEKTERGRNPMAESTPSDSRIPSIAEGRGSMNAISQNRSMDLEDHTHEEQIDHMDSQGELARHSDPMAVLCMIDNTSDRNAVRELDNREDSFEPSLCFFGAMERHKPE